MKPISSVFIFLLLLYISITSFHKSNPEKKPIRIANKEELLTQRSWRLISYGHDFNCNGKIDLSEEQVSNCEADNEYVFVRGGTGVVDEKSIICEGVDPRSSFKWSFVNQQTELDFDFGVSKIIKLTEDSLILGDTNNIPDKLIVIYKNFQ
jgi:hypothetical protein